MSSGSKCGYAVRIHRRPIARAPWLLGMAVLLTGRFAGALEAPDARDSAHPCRPPVSCTADLTSPGTLEVEAGKLYSAASGGARAASFPVTLKQTFTRLLQLQVSSNGYTFFGPTPWAHYFDNVVFGPKLHVRGQGNVAPSLAASAQLSLPTFPAGSETRSDDAFFTAFASKDVGPIHGDFNVGLDVWQLASTPSCVRVCRTAVARRRPGRRGRRLLSGYAGV